jgi:outer membrane lipoprotein-sorting protein
LSRLARAAGALAPLLLSACALFGRPPAFAPIVGEDEAMRARVERVVADAHARQTLRAVGKLRIEGPNGSGSVKQVVLAERPGRLRLESLNPLGQAATLLVTDGARYAFFDGKTLERGDVSAEVLRERLGLGLSPDDAVLALLVAPREPLDWPPTAVLGRGAEREVVMGTQSLRFAESGELAAIASLDPNGVLEWSAEYGGWRDVPGGRYPASLALWFPATRLRAELELSQVELNPPLDAALFRAARGGVE